MADKTITIESVSIFHEPPCWLWIVRSIPHRITPYKPVKWHDMRDTQTRRDLRLDGRSCMVQSIAQWWKRWFIRPYFQLGNAKRFDVHATKIP